MGRGFVRSFMNDKFYALPIEKQDRIINAGFRVFSRNSYKKSSVQAIADEAGISKSLLFFYFKNKKDLYLFLWKKMEEITKAALEESGCFEAKDIFDMMYQGIVTKVSFLKDYPDMMNFSVRVYSEEDPDVVKEVRAEVQPYSELTTNTSLPPLNPGDFKDGLDFNKMYKYMYLASEGYLLQVSRSGRIDPEQVIKDYSEMIDFWRVLFLKKE